jgi:pimeloyl-ACP methyl ester carboxylesterase
MSDMFPAMGLRFLHLILIVSILVLPVSAQRRRPDPGPQPKNIKGVVQDLRGTPLPGANVYVRDMKTNVTRTLTTNQQGLYEIYSLSPAVDYEVYASFRGMSSAKRFVSSFLNRPDNVLNFQLDMAAIASGTSNLADDDGPTIRTFDNVDLRASFQLPQGASAPIPAVLLLHGFGEDRAVWNSLRSELLGRGWAVLALDLRGHGGSTNRNGRPFRASEEWRTSSHEFPVDIDPALDWLKAQPRINNTRIVVIGSDIGANLALIASGRFPEVRTVVAINPRLNESLSMAGSAQDFTPKSALIVSNDPAEANRVRESVATPSRVLTVLGTGGTAKWAAEKPVVDAVFQWLRETF